MKKFKMVLVTAGILFLSGGAQAAGKLVHVTDMGSAMWTDLATGKLGDVVIEFRQGDELPVTFEAQGDLLETHLSSASSIGVKKNFWIRATQNNLEISLDGTTFKKINDMFSGSIEAGAGSAQNGGVANAINIVFKAFLK